MSDFLNSGFLNIINNSNNINIILLFILTLTLIIIHLFTNILKKNVFIQIVFNLPGTFFHEMAHFFVGILLFGKPVNFSLIPKIENKNISLGSVSFINLNFFNTLPIALAPYLLLFLSVILFISFSNMLIVNTNINYFVFLYSFIIYSTLISSFPSSQDWKVAFSNKIGLIFYLVLFYLIIFNFDIIKFIS